jgi:hypothetical protein
MPTSHSLVVRTRSHIAAILSAFTLLALAGCGGDDGGPPAAPSEVTDSPSTPTISGSPPTSVVVGQTYTFTPGATDPNGDALTFEIQNRPDWATFNTATGALSGSPTAPGTYSNVTISVTDGRTRASLPAFSITVQAVAQSGGQATLSWTAPTQRTDDSPLPDLAGYRIYYGNSPDNFSQVVSVNNAGLTTYVIENLSEGTWYFAVAAVDSAGTESGLSNSASKTIG